MDRISPEARSRLMSKIGPRDTKPELAVRSLLHRLGYRFRLHRKDLPGTPDLVLARHRVAIFVHGCFWHGHRCKADKMPKSRTDYWGPKIEANKARDARKARQLRKLGWRVLSVWECELKQPERLMKRLVSRISQGAPSGRSIRNAV
jgi:DNA mismatch endonuclease (patch repair protein)